MMFKALGLAVVLAALGTSPAFAALNDCSPPIAPAAVDGDTATKEQIRLALEDVKAFIKQSDDYQDCVNHEYVEIADAAKKDKKPVDPSQDALREKLLQDNQSLKERVGAEFNAAAKAYNAKHPG